MPKLIKRVAVIGAGPAGAITLDALAKEQAFDLIRVFERREAPGGSWIGDSSPSPNLSNFASLANRTADPALPIPETLPAQLPKSSQPRYTESSVYPYLETNVDHLPMEYSQEPFPKEPSAHSVSLYGPATPFRPWEVIRSYVESLVNRNGYGDLVSYNTTVENVEKVGAEWKVTLRKDGKESDYWWVEWFDAVVVASGHYWVPFIPRIDGLEEFEKAKLGSVLHSKLFRGRDHFKNKRVVVVGASVSAADIAFDLANTKTAQNPVHAITIGHTANEYFGGEAFNHPRIHNHPTIARVEAGTVHLVNGESIPDVDHIIFGTGYTSTLPYIPQIKLRNNRVPGLYQHIVYQEDPTLLFIGATAAGLTFKVFEWQAVLAARILAGRATLPPTDEMKAWETSRMRERGDGAKFMLIFPDFEEYFEELRLLAGEGEKGLGRKLPVFDKQWMRTFLAGHELRKGMWLRLNAQARAEEATENGETSKAHP
ncbi:hypothetical protein B0T25DRAFT_520898 [Lasiosphaeria hispida]|uniref:FAD/NAD(P)-binding domain-containing protein n=1 Tax=Lasiosphaeria hispida TaxID=260671 RepID=A0AAJ0HBE9_9PEZI|nr:hypothetical protein B0T25DRAFT_520898 [Lasiosphaeria hispida]